MAELKRLSPRHVVFVDAYVSHGLAERAAIVAGFSPASARTQAANMLRNPLIAAAIGARQKEVAMALKITPEKVLAEISRLAFSNPGDMFLALEQSGHDLSALTIDQRAALTSFVTETFSKGRGKNAVPVTKRKIGTADKLRALDMLARHLALYNDSLELRGAQSIVERLRAGRDRMARAKSA